MKSTPVTPIYSCDALAATRISRNQFSFNTTATAKNGAVVTKYVYTFGDGTTIESTTPVVTHEYAKDGKYAVSVKVIATVNGENKEVVSQSCNTVVEVSTPVTPPVTTTVTTLPNTGAGNVVGIFAGVSALAGAAHYAVRRRILG